MERGKRRGSEELCLKLHLTVSQIKFKEDPGQLFFLSSSPAGMPILTSLISFEFLLFGPHTLPTNSSGPSPICKLGGHR